MSSSSSSSSSAPPPSADSYIGSVISLTSKCEIRYEGILYNINTEESSIGLRNVRSFGTEGRKKDGPQIPASDKIYEYILFRGSDIRDLNVKSSPPVQTPSIHNDPAIIQSRYSHPASTSASLPPAVNGAVTDIGSHTAQMGLPRPTFQGGLPLYQSGGNIGSWDTTPAPPTANGSGVAMPMYWQGFYAPSGSLPRLQMSHLPRPPLGLPIAQSIQQPMQYPPVNASLQSGTSNLAEFHQPLFLPASSTQSLASTTLPSIVAPTQAGLLPLETTSNVMPNMSPLTSHFATGSSLMPTIFSATSIPTASSLIPNVSPVTPLPATALRANLPLVPQLISSHDLPVAISRSMPPTTSSKPMIIHTPALSYQTVSEAMPTAVGSSTSILVEPAASLVTPDQLLQPSPSSFTSSQPLQISTKDVVKQWGDKKKPYVVESTVRAPSKFKEPILPLPKPARQRLNGAVMHTHHYNRGRGRRGRGNGYSQHVSKFTEEFDFMAMNEKFNKDEVWGHLGKSKALTHEKEGENDDEYDDSLEDDAAETHKPEITVLVPHQLVCAAPHPIPYANIVVTLLTHSYDGYYTDIQIYQAISMYSILTSFFFPPPKPVYVKDDFFDTLSCNTLDRGSRGGRMKFSEQLKIDTETFGDFARHHPNRGRGRGLRGGGLARGSYNGRGYGYTSRGRGHAVSNRAS